MSSYCRKKYEVCFTRARTMQTKLRTRTQTSLRTTWFAAFGGITGGLVFSRHRDILEFSRSPEVPI